MGLMLCAADDDVAGPDISWSHYGFNLFREWLAHIEGFSLPGMVGFGGKRPWNSVTTTLAPLLGHPDDDGDLAPAQCAAMLPRLEAIVDEWPQVADDPVLQRRIDDTRRLIAVLKDCVDKGVPLDFC
ncbi:hypothetical protein SGL43_00708 [Streptomyces globisporus]|uniref:Uncharacterized protein n=1 Tax=Streptomyces globisporus TaxID=1908 RepID=A0ABN8UTY7_STRGL|nr:MULTISPECIES: hypothetical protein [Streptomyces albovinaceus subgroup]WSF77255.1 hypothetical protein OG838_14295 [Streptomyces globisporus]WSQ92380.1 hypothetical protein OG425_13645 [Streptomyces globisporus]WSU81699.1 hypothetical protein OG215_14120 [Streptomyces globisporus]WSV90350.1 hypothetical protein OG449_13855 [Streptomyces globisporus]CAH9413709.1 hypothetical protein SGL43_00708 [Streptomyces globisporus]